jgi:hypothetical protein
VSGFTYDTPFVLGTTWGLRREVIQIFDIIAEYEIILKETDSAKFPNPVGHYRGASFWWTLIWNATGKDRYPAPDTYAGLQTRLVKEKNPIFNLSKSEEIEIGHQRVIPGGEPILYYEPFLRHGFRRRFFMASKRPPRIRPSRRANG